MIRARFLLPVLFLAAVGSFVLVFTVWPNAQLKGSKDPWPMALGLLLQSLVLLFVTAWRARRAGLRVGDLYARLPSRGQSLRLAALGFSTAGLQVLLMYLVFAPLSLLFPDATQAWLFKDSPVLYSPGPPFPWFGNLAGLAAAVVAAPIAEEWFFRGLLLLRWREKWGPVAAVVGSSTVFALLHDNIGGAFAFGVVMCVLCLQYRSLLASTIVHMSNNALACAFEALSLHGLQPVGSTVADFRAEWWMPVAGCLLALPLILRVRSGYRTVSSWQFGPLLSSAMPPDDQLMPTN